MYHDLSDPEGLRRDVCAYGRTQVLDTDTEAALYSALVQQLGGDDGGEGRRREGGKWGM